ncbi:hypothetical protein GLOIN_2v1842942 [Rhizophagus clarus]|uniref:BTB domain-containing protein n=1 Tax=Rhizophagus clarus TaxID=94130 RepID=A0A8H3QJT0_9GLOM|nr:hypothetical protein GLOIN_2v1842942 [Rhizophagus clarus]
MSLSFHKIVLRDLSLMLDDSKNYDIVIQVGENQNIKEFYAHSQILKARSTYFKTALSSEWIIKKNNLIEFKKPNIEPAVFKMILSYIYIGELKLKDQPEELLIKLLVASDELLLKELFYNLQNYLIKTRSGWIQDNLIFVFNVASTLTGFKKLYQYCMGSILKDPKLFINSKEIPSFNKDALCELLNQDDYLIDEIIAWDCLIKWSIENTSNLESKKNDRTKWNKEDYEALKETFNQFIPLIRFTEISSTDFFDKVRPFKAIIPNNIYEEVMEFHMKGTLPKSITILSPRIGKLHINSRIIKSKHAYVIANWIEGNNAKAVRNENDLQYKFNLLYTGNSNSNGFDVIKFRRECKNRNPFLILIKPYDTPYDARNLAKIYGEYYSRECTTRNFIFSFGNDNDIKDIKISRMNNDIDELVVNSRNNLIFEHSNTFQMDDELRNRSIFLSVNNLFYNDNNVINSTMRHLTPKEIEIFKVSNINPEDNSRLVTEFYQG